MRMGAFVMILGMIALCVGAAMWVTADAETKDVSASADQPVAASAPAYFTSRPVYDLTPRQYKYEPSADLVEEHVGKVYLWRARATGAYYIAVAVDGWQTVFVNVAPPKNESAK